MLFLLTILIGLCGLTLCSIICNRFFHPLSKFPGPFWASQTDLWRVYHLCTKHLPEKLEALHDQLGPVIRIGPNDISFQSAAAIGPIYKSGRRVVKSEFYDGFTTFHPNVFGTRDEEHHAVRRRQMAHSFSQASLTKMEHIFDRHIMKLVDTIHAQGDRSFDLKDLLAYYTYDLMGELIFNADFGSQDAGDPEVLPRIQDHIWLGCIYGMLPSLLPYSMRFSSWIPFPWLQDKLRSRNALRDKTASHVSFELARGKDSERQNILNRLVHAKDPETGEGLPEAAIRSEAFGFLIAGSHTTSDSLTLLFYHLLHNSEAARKLSEEIRGANMASTGNLSTFSGLEQQLPYMTACLRESFRITPVFTMPLPRKVMQPEGMEIDGLHVPAGVNVSICNQVSHHDSSIWGEDVLHFRPERWLDEGTKKPSPNDLLPFGAGHRACIGRNIAMMSIAKVLSIVWGRFKLEAVDLSDELIIESVGIGEKKGPMMVKVRR